MIHCLRHNLDHVATSLMAHDTHIVVSAATLRKVFAGFFLFVSVGLLCSSFFFLPQNNFSFLSRFLFSAASCQASLQFEPKRKSQRANANDEKVH